MRDLTCRLVRRREIGEVVEPAMTDGRLKHLSDCHDLIVDGAAGRRFAGRARLDAMDPIFLEPAGCDLGQAEIAEKGE